ncbi:MAG: hypothetical protein IPP45_14545 [Sphingomonadales bacterium]|nr:hypothetical protein [Sphingomonadales bacterium]
MCALPAAIRVERVEIGEGEPVVLIIVGHERERRIAMDDPGFEDSLIARPDHLVEATL